VDVEMAVVEAGGRESHFREIRRRVKMAVAAVVAIAPTVRVVRREVPIMLHCLGTIFLYLHVEQ